jgi:crotonobetainyl-CoA:carnitine CoA-transferase CaiB-like acyl-CoA transferase
MSALPGPSTQSSSALDHLRVLDLSNHLGQVCARVLGDLGADVIKVEPPGGDPARSMPPFAGSQPDPERSLRFVNANRGKRSVVLDLSAPEDRAKVCALAERSDILVEDFAPGYLAGFGLSYEDLCKESPGLVYVSITPFGQTGPYAGYRGGDLVVQAMAGIMSANGDDEMRPCKVPYDVTSQMACLHAAYGALLAIRARGRTGQGQHVDLSRQEAAFWSQHGYIPRYSYEGIITRREGRHSAFGAVNTYRCKDGGYVNLAIFRSRHFARLGRDVMQHPILSDELWSNPTVRRENREIIDQFVQEFADTVTRDEFIERGQRAGIPISAVLTPDQFVHHPQTKARGFFREADHPIIGSHRVPGPAIGFGATPWQVHRPAPLLGQHTQEVDQELMETSLQRGAPTGAQISTNLRDRPLEGVRVVDFTRAFAGPLATMFLGFFGAEVIKVESEDLEANRAPGQVTFPDLNRNKLSCTIDARTPEGKDLVRELVRRSDVVVDNFRPGVMDNLGLGYEELRQVRPDVIMLTMPGFGNSGPLRDRVSQGQQIMGLTGLTHLWGHSDQPLETRIKVPYPDYVGGILGAISVVVALEWRERTAKGQYIELAQMEGTAHLLGVAYLDYMINGQTPQPEGNFSETHAPHDVYPCLGHDAWCAIEVGNEEEWQALVGAMGNPNWAKEERFRTLAGRVAQKENLDLNLGQWTRQSTPRQLMRLLQSAGVPAGIVVNGEDLFHDLHLRSRPGGIVEVNHEEYGPIEHQGINVRLSATPGRADGSAPVVQGRDNAYIFQEVLDLDPAKQHELQAAGALR